MRKGQSILGDTGAILEYHVSSIDYLARARARLDEGSGSALVYAALELRSGVEARIQEYLEPQPHISSRAKTTYRLNLLGKAVESVSPSEERVTRITLYDESGLHVGKLYFTPVNGRLRELAARCGDLLHALQEPRSEEWWTEVRAMLEEAYDLLRRANLGNLLGTPLGRGRQGDTMTMNISLPPGSVPLTVDLKGVRVTFKVDYLDEFPADLLDARAGGASE